MNKLIKNNKIKKIMLFILLIVLLIIYAYVANITLAPKNIILIQGEKLDLSFLWGINLKQLNNSNPNVGIYKTGKVIQASNLSKNGDEVQTGKIDLSLNIFNNIKLKDISVNIIPDTKVIPLGNSIGLKLYTQGVLIVGKSEIEGKKPYENTGIEEGDRIISINNKKILSTDDLIETVNASQGKEVTIKYARNNNELETSMLPAKTTSNEYKLGLWVRDAAAGVGTATYYEPSTQMFASLGHGITDIDTSKLITISNGELVTSNIISVQKGEKGNPGEIKGTIEGSRKIGTVTKNTALGIFGKIYNKNYLNITEKEMDVAKRDEIKTGKAQIICELETGNKKYYDIDIQKIYVGNNDDNKSMIIKVTDKELLQKTGGIIQGMSGSPIVQNGKFIGAVTHVLVNDPTTGYGIFADLMIKQMKDVK